jgi:hypothetical protein
MGVFKRGLGIVLAFAIVITVLSPMFQQVSALEYEYIVEPSALSGKDYTDSDRLAKALDQVFAGDVDIYSDKKITDEVSMPVGLYMSKDTQYHVQSKTSGNILSGWQCYIYGNAVYNKLFLEWVGRAEKFAQSRLVIPGGSNTVSFELFRDRGVRCGAYLRTTVNADGSYNSSAGHSMIVLTYDGETITYLEGNGDGNGLIRVTTRTWSDFNKKQLSGKGRYIAHVIQPTDVFYDAQYPACKHEAYDQSGICSGCGDAFDWESTFTPWPQGNFLVTEKVTPSKDAPYSAAATAALTLNENQSVKVLGECRNAFGEVWYLAENAGGDRFYVPASALKLDDYAPFEATCKGFSPENGAQLEQKSYPVKGTVTANSPLKAVYGYLDGELYATWNAANETTTELDLRKTDLNHKLSFSKLAEGKHTVRVVAESLHQKQSVTVHESEFCIVIPQPCSHEYTGTVTQAATCTQNGLMTYVCSKCEESYTQTVDAYGHDYQQGVCTRCGDRKPLAALSGKVHSGGKQDEPVRITLTQNGIQMYTTTAESGSYAIADIMPGSYVITVSQDGCPTWDADLTLEQGNTELDVKVCAYGDVTGDGRLNIGDVSKLYGHVRGTGTLRDAYALLCADYNRDGTLNIGDVVRLYGFLRQ